ncbi:MAG: hypothetical protein K2L42_02455 [Clostridia bacterium]|nr:hypothetical protein [Clostridia bacterium]
MEKFALLNLLKALETLSPQKPSENANQSEPRQTAPSPETQPPQPAEQQERLNVMANVLTRHEEISNRLKNKR